MKRCPLCGDFDAPDDFCKHCGIPYKDVNPKPVYPEPEPPLPDFVDQHMLSLEHEIAELQNQIKDLEAELHFFRSTFPRAAQNWQTMQNYSGQMGHGIGDDGNL